MKTGLVVLLVILAILVCLIIVLCVNAVKIKAKNDNKEVKSFEPQLDKDEIAKKLSRMVQVETISRPNQGVEEKFAVMRGVLEELFPTLFEQSEKNVLAGNGLLLRWPGKDSSKAPYMFMSHMDVVPVDGKWERDPFSGDISDGKVFGRGSCDTKGSLSVILSALDHLAQEGFVPGRDIYVLSTASEEVSGPDAHEAVQYFKDRGIKLDLVMDEGGGIVKGLIPGFDGAIAAIGISEKSQANADFIVKTDGGHASAPPRQSALGKLGEFVNDVEKNPPFDYKITPEFKKMLLSVAPYMNFAFRLVLANLWLFSPIMTPVLKRIPTVRTMMGTTIAFTMAKGSDAFNVLPNEASVTANMRVSHHQGVRGSLEAIGAKAKEHGIIMKETSSFEIKSISDTSSDAFKALSAAIKGVYPGVAVTPFIVMANTDCRHFHEVCDTAVRFMPMKLRMEETKHVHTTDEFISTDSFGTGAQVIIDLVKKS